MNISLRIKLLIFIHVYLASVLLDIGFRIISSTFLVSGTEICLDYQWRNVHISQILGNVLYHQFKQLFISTLIIVWFIKRFTDWAGVLKRSLTGRSLYPSLSQCPLGSLNFLWMILYFWNVQMCFRDSYVSVKCESDGACPESLLFRGS